MSPGLLKLLKIIEEQPMELKLVDRFLMLVNDGPAQDRAASISKLAKTLMPNYPMRAIEIAFKEYKAGFARAANIALIIDALVVLKMPEKSAMIRAEMMRFWNKQISQDDRNLAQLAIEEHVTIVLSQQEIAQQVQVMGEPLRWDEKFYGAAGLDVASLSSLGVQPRKKQLAKPETKNIDVLNIPTFNRQPAPEPVFAPELVFEEPLIGVKSGFVPGTPDEADTQNSYEVEKELEFLVPQTVALDYPKSRSQVEPEESQFLIKREGSQSHKSEAVSKTNPILAEPRNDIRARISVSSNADGIPARILPPDSVQQSRAKIGILAPASSPRREEVYKYNLDEEKDVKEQFNRLVTNEDWEGVLEKLGEAMALTTDVQFLLNVFERKKLEKIDIRFAKWWIDILLAARHERRALRYIQQKLIDEESLIWARMTFPKIQMIRSRLDLSQLEWRESDGVASLRKIIFELRPKLQCYWACSSKVS